MYFVFVYQTTVVRNTSQKDVQNTKNQESFHLQCSLTEADEIEKQVSTTEKKPKKILMDILKEKMHVDTLYFF
jgi:hypothetical protein